MNEILNKTEGNVVKRVILLVRVSTDQQSEKSQDAQEDALIAFAEGKGFNRSEMEIIKPEEGGESAVKLSLAERATIQKMYAVIDNPQNKIEAVFCWALDRLSRRPKDLYELRDFFVSRKINLITQEFNLHLFNDQGIQTSEFNFMFGMLTTFAEDEGRKRSLRTMQGKKLKSEKGYAVNGGVFFGYYKDADKKIQIDTKQAETVKLIFNLYSTGRYGVLSIQRELESRGITIETFKISKILSYRLYTGERIQGVFNRQLPQIITTEIFEQCRKIAKTKNSKANKTNRIYYAGRLIKCSDCGSYAFRQRNKDLRLYEYKHPLDKTPPRKDDYLGEKHYVPWDKIYIERFVSSK